MCTIVIRHWQHAKQRLAQVENVARRLSESDVFNIFMLFLIIDNLCILKSERRKVINWHR